MLRFSIHRCTTSRVIATNTSAAAESSLLRRILPTNNNSRNAVVVSHLSPKTTITSSTLSQPIITRNLTTIRSTIRILNYNTNHNHKLLRHPPSSHYYRMLSTKTDNSKKSGDEAADETKELVLTPGQKVVVASRLTMWAGIAVFASFCAYYIVKELMPSKMSPNAVFDKSFAIIRNDPNVVRKLGGPLKAYGKDYGGHREGRRNFVEHTEYTNQDDGSKRTRVRYNLEGQHGQAFVFAEVSKDMPSGEFVYIIVQDKRDGRVTTIVDNRSKMAMEKMMKGNEKGMEAFSNLLGSGSGKSNGGM